MEEGMRKGKMKGGSLQDEGDEREYSRTIKESLGVGDFLNSTLEEPEWLKKIFGSLHYRIVLINVRDLVRCNITAYTPVEVVLDNTSCAFLAIPDQNVRIGHVALHHKSCVQYFPEICSNTLLWVRKINTVNLTDEVLLTPSNTLPEQQHSFIERQLKYLLYNNFPLGSPFTLKLGDKVYLPSLNNADISFSVTSYNVCNKSRPSSLQGGSLVEDFKNLNLTGSDDLLYESSGSIPPLLVTVDECEISVVNNSSTSITSSAFLTLDEICSVSVASDSSVCDNDVLTSTPKKVITSDSNSRRSFLTSKTDNKEISLSEKDQSQINGGDCCQQSCGWIRTGLQTKVKLQQLKKSDDAAQPAAAQVVPKRTYCSNAAYTSLLKIMQTKLNIKFKENSLLGGWNGVLVCGASGTGKTMMVHKAAAELDLPVVTLTLAEVTRASVTPEDCVRNKFLLARQCAPSVLFLDEVDSVCVGGERRSHTRRDLTPAVIQGIQSLQVGGEAVLVVAATSQAESVGHKLRSPAALDKQLTVPLPNTCERDSILQQLLSCHKHSMNQGEVTAVAKQAYGFSGADMCVLLRCAWLHCVARLHQQSCSCTEGGTHKCSCTEGDTHKCSCTEGDTQKCSCTQDLCLCREDLLAGLRSVVPTILRHNYSAVSVVRWSDICGYQHVKTKLQEMIDLHRSDPEKHKLKGVLLYGPPGCSKTMFVRALVHETGFTFFPLKCSDVLSKYVGETEKSLNKVFRRASEAAPAIIFMDEVDTLCGERGGSGGLLSELLSLMTHTPDVMVIAATNRPHAVDEAVLQPGCLEHVIHIDLPDFNSRCEIWKGLLEDVPLQGQVDVEKLSEATLGYSGAEITAIYQEAAHNVISQLYDGDSDATQDSVTISEQLLFRVIQTTPSRTPLSLLESIRLFTGQRH
ncbi:ATPase family gene 2 protein homolog A isoform X3 [Cherax quadricarinatus]